jgi:hypothetical protein
MELNEQLIEIQKHARFMHTLRGDHNVPNLFLELNKLNNLELVKSDYLASDKRLGPVNDLRRTIWNMLAIREKVTPEIIEKLKENHSSAGAKRMFQAWNHFALLYPFFQNDITSKTKNVLKYVADQISSNLGLNGSVKTAIVNFNGGRNFGTDHVWFAIYNAFHRDQTLAKQLFFSIDHNGIQIALYDRRNDYFIAQQLLQLGKDFVSESSDFFEKHKQAILNDNEPDLLVIGCSGSKIYKLSHGTDFFSEKGIQYCIEEQVAVISKYVKSIGTFNEPQFETFKKARRGDFFYVCHGNSELLLIGQFIDDNIEKYIDQDDLSEDDEWRQRKYKFITVAKKRENYTGEQRWWTPNFTSTFVEITRKPGDLEVANKILFEPYFGCRFDPDIEANLPEEIDKQVVRIKRSNPLSIKDNNVDPQLDVEMYAMEFCLLLENLSDEKGNVLGIFGNWGRGKTFFFDQVKKKLNTLNQTRAKSLYESNSSLENEQKVDQALLNSYEVVEFNAWKYQNTHEIWAYVYETFLNHYIGGATGRRKFHLLWKLNLKRNGKWRPRLLLFGLLLIIAGFLASPFLLSLKYLLVWIPSISLLGIWKFNEVYAMLQPAFTNVSKQYITLPGFKKHLGLHAEIQKELKTLLEVILPDELYKTRENLLKKRDDDSKVELIDQTLDKSIRKDFVTSKLVDEKNSYTMKTNKLLFFVDDIDRCQEGKIIEIIDALRTLLDEESIIKRIVIVIAVDERILKSAVANKYEKLNETDYHEENTLPKRVLEYMDKLFIASIKLPPIASINHYTIIKNYAEHIGIIELLEQEDFTNDSTKKEDIEKQTTENITLEEEDIFPIEEQKTIELKESNYFLSTQEVEALTQHAALLGNEVTPRKLRIFMYRYLFAKNIVASKFRMGTVSINDDYYLYLIELIAKASNPSEKEENPTSQPIEMDDSLNQFTTELVKMVVPY